MKRIALTRKQRNARESLSVDAKKDLIGLAENRVDPLQLKSSIRDELWDCGYLKRDINGNTYLTREGRNVGKTMIYDDFNVSSQLRSLSAKIQER